MGGGGEEPGTEYHQIDCNMQMPEVMYRSVPLYLGTVLPLRVAHDNNIDGTRLLDVKICTQPSPIATFRPRPSACCARRYFQIGR